MQRSERMTLQRLDGSRRAETAVVKVGRRAVHEVEDSSKSDLTAGDSSDERLSGSVFCVWACWACVPG